MFRKVFQSITRPFSASKTKEDKKRRRASEGSVLEKVARGGKLAGGETGAETAEERCGITPGMNKSQITAQLKLLYRRHNRGASSLDPRMRAESEKMLEAIVEVREKYFGEI